MQSIDWMIATLNTVEVGELEGIQNELLEVRGELMQRELGELVDHLDACLAALRRGDLKDFRRIKETIVSRLGHLR
jgi:hypothetical protein